jgi:hypothetical protein
MHFHRPAAEIKRDDGGKAIVIRQVGEPPGHLPLGADPADGAQTDRRSLGRRPRDRRLEWPGGRDGWRCL